MWNSREFQNQAVGCWRQYTTQVDRWFSWGAQRDVTLAALNMYRCASQGTLPIHLLGDAKIRTDLTLVANFGVASVSDLQAAEDQTIFDQTVARQGPAFKTFSPAIPVSMRGGILKVKDPQWSPLLNDSFILGGVHSGSEFHLAFDDFNAFDMEQRRQASGAVAPQVAAAPARGPEYYQEVWKLYLKAKPEVLWNSQLGVPRVFARELIGLRTFGYTPDFNAGGLGFGGSSAPSADFAHYLMALSNAGFPQKDKSSILSAISLFLFGDKALA